MKTPTSLRSMSNELPDGTSPDFPLWVTEEEDGSLTIHWDENHPVTSCFNGWTGEMFIEMLLASAKEILGDEG